MSDEHSTGSTSEVEYRPIKGFEGYRVGDDGTVWTCKKPASTGRCGCTWVLSDEWRQLKMRLVKQGRGYYSVMLYGGGANPKARQVSHLVLEAFRGPRPDGCDACHDPDPDPKNNTPGNLRWDTKKANIQDLVRWRKKNGVPTPLNCRLGSAHHCSKLTADKVYEIRRLAAQGVSLSSLGRQFGITVSVAWEIHHRKSWKHLPEIPVETAPARE